MSNCIVSNKSVSIDSGNQLCDIVIDNTKIQNLETPIPDAYIGPSDESDEDHSQGVEAEQTTETYSACEEKAIERVKIPAVDAEDETPLYNIFESAARRSERHLPGWQKGVEAFWWRWMIASILLLEFTAMILGWTINSSQNDIFLKAQRFTFAVACNCVFEITSETWLDWVRMESLAQSVRKIIGKPVEQTSLILLEVNILRERFHAQDRHDGIIPSLPYLGPHNWHYETSACIRDVLLSILVLMLYLLNVTAFSVWWDTLIAATYLSDMLFLLSRWPAITASWLHFVSLHHIFTMVFLVLSSFLITEVHEVVLRAYALGWFSNALTTFPLVYRSFTGQENDFMTVSGIISQRFLRWGGTIAAMIGLDSLDSDPRDLHQLMFNTPTMYIISILCLLLLEVLDVPLQLKKVFRIIKKHRNRQNKKKVMIPRQLSSRSGFTTPVDSYNPLFTKYLGTDVEAVKGESLEKTNRLDNSTKTTN
mmetsp:Transcript_14522/g.20500  ORF Transcript_14522/g.20500 Transcript_14522/m.20500 type:complete len:480 (-) Transcript_14522:289-1728(-)